MPLRHVADLVTATHLHAFRQIAARESRRTASDGTDVAAHPSREPDRQEHGEDERDEHHGQRERTVLDVVALPYLQQPALLFEYGCPQ
jgi:hypothetical protein